MSKKENITAWLIFISYSLLVFISGYKLSEQRNQAYISQFKKYTPVISVMQEMKTRKYDVEKYNCVNFSVDAQTKLKAMGINSSVIVGTNHTQYDHAYIGIWIDPQSGDFINNYDFVRVMQ